MKINLNISLIVCLSVFSVSKFLPLITEIISSTILIRYKWFLLFTDRHYMCAYVELNEIALLCRGRAIPANLISSHTRRIVMRLYWKSNTNFYQLFHDYILFYFHSPIPFGSFIHSFICPNLSGFGYILNSVNAGICVDLCVIS